MATYPIRQAPVTLPAPAAPRWETIRFRRAKDSKGWALLGIPHQVYPLIVTRLFEQRAKLIQKHDAEEFVSILFEAPATLAAKLALAFPAPPGCEVLKIAPTRDRVLSGKAANSKKALQQAMDSAA